MSDVWEKYWANISEEERRQRTEDWAKSGNKGREIWWGNLSEEGKAQFTVNWHNASHLASSSPQEDLVAKVLDEKGIKYERQKRIWRYQVDFYLPEINTIIEVQGCYWHGCPTCRNSQFKDLFPEKRPRERYREEWLRKKGYILKYIWEHELKENMTQMFEWL